MSLNPPSTLELPAAAAHAPAPAVSRRARRRRWRARLYHWFVLLLALQVAGGEASTWRSTTDALLNQATSGRRFNIVAWEIDALRDKAAALRHDPAAGMTENEAVHYVRAYMHDARLLDHLDWRAEILEGWQSRRADDILPPMRAKAESLRADLALRRPAAEAIVQGQVDAVLRDAGFGVGGRIWPPVLFTFTESPKELVVSPRARIVNAFTRMLDPNIGLSAREQIEQVVEANPAWSAYVTDTGGMGAFPTMVDPAASLSWVLSTVAHEWTHTYLSFFPLGFNYGATADNRIINETTADIVGDEIGRRVLERFYPELIPPPARDDTPPLRLGAGERASVSLFDYGAEMAQTRKVTDQLLRYRGIADAEQYLELRRQVFAENGYIMRKLNQAWFAFHGSYGNSVSGGDYAADVSTPDATAPKVVALRAQSADVRTFLQTIRGITTAEGLDKLLNNR